MHYVLEAQEAALLPVATGTMPVCLSPRPAAAGPAKPGAVATNSLDMKLVTIPAGEYGDTPLFFRSASRDALEPNDRACSIGFRVVCEIE